MASTFDTLLRLELQATGENINTWGEKTNNNIELLTDAIAGATSINLAGSGDYTLTTANAATDQARKSFITLTGTLTGNRNVIVPSSSKIYFIRNNTSGAFSVTFKTAAGSGAVIPQGYVLAVACDGTDCFDASEVARVAKAGDTMTGALLLPSGLPANAARALRSDEVDVKVAAAVPAGVITMWAGSIATIPTGWALCNGANGTPDLRDRFVVGAGSTYAVGATGGATSATTSSNGAHTHSGATGSTTLTTDQIPSHTHTGSTGYAGDHAHVASNLQGPNAGIYAIGTTAPGFPFGPGATSTAGGHTHTLAIDAAGGGQGHTHTIASDGDHTHTVATLPPYYALAYIMKL